MEKNVGFYQKYEVKKITNPKKTIDCVVLEFDDPIARVGILAWAEAMRNFGYELVYKQVKQKITAYNERE